MYCDDNVALVLPCLKSEINKFILQFSLTICVSVYVCVTERQQIGKVVLFIF